MNGPQDTIETRKWTVRQISLKTYYLTVEMNGAVRDLQRTVYGADDLGIVGLTEQVKENTGYRGRMVALIRVLKWVLGGVGTVFFTFLGVVLNRVF